MVGIFELWHIGAIIVAILLAVLMLYGMNKAKMD